MILLSIAIRSKTSKINWNELRLRVKNRIKMIKHKAAFCMRFLVVKLIGLTNVKSNEVMIVSKWSSS